MDEIFKGAKCLAYNLVNIGGKIGDHVIKDLPGGNAIWPAELREKHRNYQTMVALLRDGRLAGLSAMGEAAGKEKRERALCLAVVLTAIVSGKRKCSPQELEWPIGLQSLVSAAERRFRESVPYTDNKVFHFSEDQARASSATEVETLASDEDEEVFEEDVDALRSDLMEMHLGIEEWEQYANSLLAEEEQCLEAEEATKERLAQTEQVERAQMAAAEAHIEEWKTRHNAANQKAVDQQTMSRRRLAQVSEELNNTQQQLAEESMIAQQWMQAEQRESAAAADLRAELRVANARSKQQFRSVEHEQAEAIRGLKVMLQEEENYAAKLTRCWEEAEEAEEANGEMAEEAMVKEEMPDEPEEEQVFAAEMLPQQGGEADGNPLENAVEWIRSCDGRDCLCICYFSNDLDNIFQNAKSTAGSLLHYSGKIADHMCDIEGSWPDKILRNSFQLGCLKDGPFAGIKAFGHAHPKERRERALCVSMLITAAIVGSTNGNEGWTEAQMGWVEPFVELVEIGRRKFEVLTGFTGTALTGRSLLTPSLACPTDSSAGASHHSRRTVAKSKARGALQQNRRLSRTDSSCSGP
jgi:chemotaxis protein histidine kinase CheA